MSGGFSKGHGPVHRHVQRHGQAAGCSCSCYRQTAAWLRLIGPIASHAFHAKGSQPKGYCREFLQHARRTAVRH